MSRRKGTSYQKDIRLDPVYQNEDVARFINAMMKGGKKSLSQRIFYGAMDIVKQKSGQDGISIFHSALGHVKPTVEVASRRVGGMTYQVPREVRSGRTSTLAIRWLVAAARSRRNHGMSEKLAAELMEAAKGQGNAVKKRNDTSRAADANRAFSHYRW